MGMNPFPSSALRPGAQGWVAGTQGTPFHHQLLRWTCQTTIAIFTAIKSGSCCSRYILQWLTLGYNKWSTRIISGCYCWIKHTYVIPTKLTNTVILNTSWGPLVTSWLTSHWTIAVSAICPLVVPSCNHHQPTTALEAQSPWALLEPPNHTSQDSGP